MKLNLLDFPKMVGTLVWGLIVYTLTEVETFLLVVTSALIGYQLGWLVGLTVFLATYFVIRMIGGYVSMIASNLEFIARRTGRKNV